MKTILQTESSPGWGGQEMRILKESLGMRDRGYTVIFAVQKHSGLYKEASNQGFKVYTLDYRWKKTFSNLFCLMRLIKKHQVDAINTHSSKDSWFGGLAGKLLKIKVIRTRHLSTPVKGHWNRMVLYRFLPDVVVTTCQQTADVLREQANLPLTRCFSVATGIDPCIQLEQEQLLAFKKQFNLKNENLLIGTLCIMRWWKGIDDMLQAARLLKQKHSHFKWIIIGSGVSQERFEQRAAELEVTDVVIFTGFIENPYPALAALDIFMLLSTAHEGVSQASLQAAFLEKPLVTTRTGGLAEVCLDGKTGFLVNNHSPQEVADAAEKLASSKKLRETFGQQAKQLVLNQFTFKHTLDQMEQLYR